MTKLKSDKHYATVILTEAITHQRFETLIEYILTTGDNMLTYIVTLMQLLILIAATSLIYDLFNLIFQFDEGDIKDL